MPEMPYVPDPPASDEGLAAWRRIEEIHRAYSDRVSKIIRSTTALNDADFASLGIGYTEAEEAELERLRAVVYKDDDRRLKLRGRMEKRLAQGKEWAT